MSISNLGSGFGAGTPASRSRGELSCEAYDKTIDMRKGIGNKIAGSEYKRDSQNQDNRRGINIDADTLTNVFDIRGG